MIRLKPYGNTAAPAHLTHLKDPHGTKYFKVDPKGDLSYENEAFKVYARQPLPKAPKQVKLPEGAEFGTPQAEEYLKQRWTYKTHVPLAPSVNGDELHWMTASSGQVPQGAIERGSEDMAGGETLMFVEPGSEGVFTPGKSAQVSVAATSGGVAKNTASAVMKCWFVNRQAANCYPYNCE